MWSNCPPLVLGDQLEILAPRAVVLLGTATHRSVQALPGLKVSWDPPWKDNERCFARGEIMIGTDSVPVFALSHPAAARWNRALSTLSSSLVGWPMTV